MPESETLSAPHPSAPLRGLPKGKGLKPCGSKQEKPSPTPSVPVAVQAHQGRFAPLRGAQVGILDPSSRRRAGPMVGTGRRTGLSAVRTKNTVQRRRRGTSSMDQWGGRHGRRPDCDRRPNRPGRAWRDIAGSGAGAAAPQMSDCRAGT